MVETSNSPTNLLDLPSDLLLQIVTRLDHNDRLSFSVVSRSLRSLITYQFVHKLIIDRYLPSDYDFQKLFSRFPSVTRLAIQCQNELSLSQALTSISMSQLKIEELEISVMNIECLKLNTPPSVEFSGMVKVLKLDCFTGSMDYFQGVTEFIRLFPSLEELNLSKCSSFNGEGIEKLLSSAPYLWKIEAGGCAITSHFRQVPKTS